MATENQIIEHKKIARFLIEENYKTRKKAGRTDADDLYQRDLEKITAQYGSDNN